MKPNELRIGNFIQGNYENENSMESIALCQVVALDVADCAEYSIMVESSANKEFYDEFKPILLTESWLYKLANEMCIIKYIEKNTYVFDRFRLIWKEGYNYWYVIDDMTEGYITKIKCVHEFQNMFYVLNGKELKI